MTARSALFATSLLATIAGLATASHADSITADAEAPAKAAPRVYLQAGAMLGGTEDLVFGALSLDGGGHLGGPLWVHGMVADGTASQLLATGSGSFTQVRVGVEVRTCGWAGLACFMFGVDGGFQHASFTGTQQGWFGGGSTMVSVSNDSLVAVPRIGLDIGRAVRVRPGLEVALGPDHASGFAATLALAYQW